ncbi:MAG TPA: hypothetical protein DEA40_12660 [Parvularcula sp.]|nr:hypothetical protein [Parvularcula sp.]HBS33551.1 hypothetical protein [Parvularcula sp.]
MTAPAPIEDPAVASIKANIVFEKMIASVLAATALAAAIRFTIGLGDGAGAALFGAAAFALLFFFAAFGAAVAVGVPLYLRLEKAKLRKAWPYALAAGIVSFLVLGALGAAPSYEAPWRALYGVPGVAAALLFARKMRPFWTAAARADAALAAGAVIRLH